MRDELLHVQTQKDALSLSEPMESLPFDMKYAVIKCISAAQWRTTCMKLCTRRTARKNVRKRPLTVVSFVDVSAVMVQSVVF
jgi:hypothetical protein